MFRFFTALLIFFAAALPAAAQEMSAPKPGHHPARQLEQERKEREGKKAELELKAKQIDSDLAETKKSLIDIAAEIKKNEGKLTELDGRIRAGDKEQDEIEGRLKKDRHSIGNLVLALERLDRTPPEAILARPGAPLQTAQSAMLLQSILPNIYGRAESLKKDLARLEELIAQLQRDKLEVKETSEKLALRQEEIAALMKKRKALYAETQTGIRQEETALREISAKAQNLQELVAKIGERERQQAEEERARAASARKADKEKSAEEAAPVRAAAFRPTPIPRPGSAQLPISGMIKVGFNQIDDIGAESQGLTIEGRPRGLVVSPMGGVVRYAGYFKNYGKIIIVEHQKDYHSLIAGLDRIDTVVGQSVAAGEPVGTLAKSGPAGGSPTLYYELRLNGEPVNPAAKFAGL